MKTKKKLKPVRPAPNYQTVGPLFVRDDLVDEWAYQQRKWGRCRACPLYHTNTNYVLASGVLPAEVLFIGEGPGNSEDICGEPFIGRSGSLLRHIIRDSYEVVGQQYGYCLSNVVACRPNQYYKLHLRENPEGPVRKTVWIPGANNRAPNRAEASACSPRVQALIALCSPALVVLVGQTAAQWVQVPESLSYVKLYHPRYLLRGSKTPHKTSDYQRTVVTLSTALKNALSKDLFNADPDPSKQTRSKTTQRNT